MKWCSEQCFLISAPQPFFSSPQFCCPWFGCFDFSWPTLCIKLISGHCAFVACLKLYIYMYVHMALSYCRTGLVNMWVKTFKAHEGSVFLLHGLWFSRDSLNFLNDFSIIFFILCCFFSVKLFKTFTACFPLTGIIPTLFLPISFPHFLFLSTVAHFLIMTLCKFQ